MPNNYAKRRTPRQFNRRKNSNNNLWIWVVVLIILLAAGLFYLKTQRHKLAGKHHQEPPQKAMVTKAALVKPPVAGAAKETTPQPQFDFYTLLPKTELAEPVINKPTANIVLPKPSVTVPLHYVLHIASLKNLAAADQLKAQLALLGFSVVVDPVPINGITWMRVDVGPYTSLAAARIDQQRLRKNNLGSTLAKTLR